MAIENRTGFQKKTMAGIPETIIRGIQVFLVFGCPVFGSPLCLITKEKSTMVTKDWISEVWLLSFPNNTIKVILLAEIFLQKISPFKNKMNTYYFSLKIWFIFNYQLLNALVLQFLFPWTSHESKQDWLRPVSRLL
jgi:Mn2+/Fe2+ NRAMP family transporter